MLPFFLLLWHYKTRRVTKPIRLKCITFLIHLVCTCESMSNLLIDDGVTFDNTESIMFIRLALASFQVPLKMITIIFVYSFVFAYMRTLYVCVCVWWSKTLINVWWWSKWNSFASSAAYIYLFESNSNKQQKKNKRTNKQHQQKFAVTVLYFHFWSNFTPNVANFMSEMNLYLLISQCTLKRNFELSGCQTICG